MYASLFGLVEHMPMDSIEKVVAYADSGKYFARTFHGTYRERTAIQLFLVLHAQAMYSFDRFDLVFR